MRSSPSFVKHLPHLARGEPAFPEMAGDLVQSIPLAERPLTFGRGKAADVVLGDSAVAVRHAVLEYVAGTYVLADQQTQTGTFVNGKSIESVRLEPGDLIHLGTYLFCFKESHLLWVRQPVSPRLAAIKLCQTTPEGVQLLEDVSLVFQPGEFVGLLGPSGAGKTTLLDALNGFRPAASGRVLLGGETLYENFERLSSVIGYVPQNDLVHLELTTRQALEYVGRLRLPALSAGERRRAVEETLDLLDLTQRADVPIGKLSGGQRKRASVGVELLCKPAILFLDEPTSGLDPGAESKLMHTLHQLAALGKTIVCTTHIMENVERFDKIAVLAPGGKLAFFGPPHDALEFFGVAKFLDLYERLEEESPRVWQETFRRNRLFRKLRAHVHRERLPRPVQQQTPRLSPPPISSLGQALTLTARATRILVSDPRQLLLTLVQPLLMGGLMCAVFDKLPVLSFLLVIASLWFGCSLAAQAIVKERPIYRRERMVGLRLGPYLFSKFMPAASLGLVQSLLLLGVVHFTRGPVDWGTYLPTLVLASWCGAAMGLVISACAANADKATGIVPLVLLPQIVLAGVLLPIGEMNRPTNLVSYAIPARWANHAVEIAQFEGKRINTALVSDDANLVPLWNLFPDQNLRSDAGRRNFLQDLGNTTVRRQDDLPGVYLALGLFMSVQLMAVAAVLRRQDVF